MCYLNSKSHEINTFKYHVFAPMGIFQLELIYLYFPPSFLLLDGRTVENKGKLTLTKAMKFFISLGRKKNIFNLVK